MNRTLSPVSLRTAGFLVKVHHLLIAPWVVFSVPPRTVLGLQAAAVILIVFAGLFGTLNRKKELISSASSGLIAVLVGGKIVADLDRLTPPDTAVLLSQFIVIIFLMEASFPVVEYELEMRSLRERDDELSLHMIDRVQKWFGNQLAADLRLGIACFVLSLALLTLGSFASIRVGQLALLALFLLAAVIALFILLTYHREPETVRHARR